MIHVAISVFPIESEIESITDRGSNQLQSCWTSEVVPPASKCPFAKQPPDVIVTSVEREREGERYIYIYIYTVYVYINNTYVCMCIYIYSGKEIDRHVGLRCHDMYAQEDIAYTLHMYDMYVDIVYVDIEYIYIYDGLSKCLFPVLLINRNSMRAASCLPLKNLTYLDGVKTWKFFVTFGNLSKTTGMG